MMRKLAFTAFAALIAASPAWADAWDFILTNSTGKEIKSLDLAPTGTQDWQPNKVDADMAKTFKPGARTTVHFDRGAKCNYDIRATFADSTTIVWTNVNVCDDSYVTVKLGADGVPSFTAN